MKQLECGDFADMFSLVGTSQQTRRSDRITLAEPTKVESDRGRSEDGLHVAGYADLESPATLTVCNVHPARSGKRVGAFARSSDEKYYKISNLAVAEREGFPAK